MAVLALVDAVQMYGSFRCSSSKLRRRTGLDSGVARAIELMTAPRRSAPQREDAGV